MIIIERKIHFGQGQNSRKELQNGEAKPSTPAGRVSRISRLTTSAICRSVNDTTPMIATFHPIAGAGDRFRPPHVGLRKFFWLGS